MQNVFEVEVDQNFDAFVADLDRLLPLYRGKFALMRHGNILAFHPNEASALAAGREEFGDGVFSVQEVTDRPADLGFFSHAINTRIA